MTTSINSKTQKELCMRIRTRKFKIKNYETFYHESFPRILMSFNTFILKNYSHTTGQSKIHTGCSMVKGIFTKKPSIFENS